MKSLFLTLCSCILAISLFAQDAVIGKYSNSELKKNAIKMEFNDKAAFDAVSDVPFVINPSRALISRYDKPAGALIPSLICEEGGWGYIYGGAYMFGSAYTVPWVMRNVCTDADKYEWRLGTNVWSSDSIGTFFWAGEDGEFPYLKPHYLYNYMTLRAYLGTAYDDYTPALYTNTQTGQTRGGYLPSGGFMYAGTADYYGNTTEDAGMSRYSVTSTTQYDGTGTGYFFGTCLNGNQRTGHLISMYRKPQSSMLVESVTFLLYTEEGYSIAQSTHEFHVCVYKLNKLTPEEEALDWRLALNFDENDKVTNELIGEGRVFGSDIIPDPQSPNTVGYIQIPFYEIVDGLEFPVPLAITDAFAIVLYGMDQNDIRCGTYVDRDNKIDRRSFFTFKNMSTGKLDRNPAHGGVSMYNAADVNLNMFLMLKASFPYLFVEEGQDVLTAPNGGGNAVTTTGKDAIFFSDLDFVENAQRYIWYDSLIDEDYVHHPGPDWVKITPSSFYDNEGGLDYLKLQIKADPLPAGLSGREAEIKVWVFGHAEETVFKVIQGTPPVVEYYTVTFIVKDEDGDAIEDATITFDNEEIDGYVIENVEVGTYQYTVKKEGYIEESGTVEVEDGNVEKTVTLQAVGISAKSVSSIQLYPNPFKNEINISTPSIVKSVQIMNLAGQSVKGVSLNGKSISTGELSNGVYFVIIESVSGEKAVHKMVKK